MVDLEVSNLCDPADVYRTIRDFLFDLQTQNDNWDCIAVLPVKAAPKKKKRRVGTSTNTEMDEICPACGAAKSKVLGFPWCHCLKCGHVYKGQTSPVA